MWAKRYLQTKAAALPGDAGSCVDVVAQMEAHHAEVGAYLLGLWGFPNPIVEAVAFHHTPSRASEAGLGLSAMVHIADRLVHQRKDSRSGSSDLGAGAGIPRRSGPQSLCTEVVCGGRCLEQPEGRRVSALYLKERRPLNFRAERRFPQREVAGTGSGVADPGLPAGPRLLLGLDQPRSIARCRLRGRSARRSRT